MDLVVHAGSVGEAEARVRVRVRGSHRMRLFLRRPLTFGCRLVLPRTSSAKPSPRKRGEGMRTDD